jgi:Glutaredoxin-like domain (DUF836)
MNVLSFLRRALALTKPREDLHFVLYTRGGCHLCESAWQELTNAQASYRFVLEKRDVDAEPEWAARFGECVPVVTVNDKVRFRGSVNSVLLQRLLDAS